MVLKKVRLVKHLDRKIQPFDEHRGLIVEFKSYKIEEVCESVLSKVLYAVDYIDDGMISESGNTVILGFSEDEINQVAIDWKEIFERQLNVAEKSALNLLRKWVSEDWDYFEILDDNNSPTNSISNRTITP